MDLPAVAAVFRTGSMRRAPGAAAVLLLASCTAAWHPSTPPRPAILARTSCNRAPAAVRAHGGHGHGRSGAASVPASDALELRPAAAMVRASPRAGTLSPPRAHCLPHVLNENIPAHVALSRVRAQKQLWTYVRVQMVRPVLVVVVHATCKHSCKVVAN